MLTVRDEAQLVIGREPAMPEAVDDRVRGDAIGGAERVHGANLESRSATFDALDMPSVAAIDPGLGLECTAEHPAKLRDVDRDLLGRDGRGDAIRSDV